MFFPGYLAVVSSVEVTIYCSSSWFEVSFLSLPPPLFNAHYPFSLFLSVWKDVNQLLLMVYSFNIDKEFYIVADVNPGKVILKSAFFYFQSYPHPTPLLGRGTDYLIGGKKYFPKGVGGNDFPGKYIKWFIKWLFRDFGLPELANFDDDPTVHSLIR